MIIAITGAIGSGKDTIADYLIAEFGFKRLAFATKVKDVAHVVFGWDREMLEGRTAESRAWREVVDPYWGLSPRVALQRIGTEMFRTHIHPETWVKAVVKEIQTHPETNYVITDCRFDNEVAALKELGASLWSVSRGAAPAWSIAARAGAECPAGIHTTDWNVYRLEGIADVRIENNADLRTLYGSIDAHLLTTTVKKSSAT
jgi:hypothetical protein